MVLISNTLIQKDSKVLIKQLFQICASNYTSMKYICRPEVCEFHNLLENLHEMSKFKFLEKIGNIFKNVVS